MADLNKQVEILTESLRNVTRRYWILKRRSASLGAARLGQVAQKLLSSLGPDDEDDTPAEEALEAPEQPSLPSEPSASHQPEEAGGEKPTTSGKKPATSAEKPSTSQQPREKSPPLYPNHVAVLSESDTSLAVSSFFFCKMLC